jgi:hypothetical protein
MLHHRLVTAYVYLHILHSEAGNVAPDVFGFTLASQSLEQAMRPEQAGGAAEESTRLRRGAEFNNGIHPTSVGWPCCRALARDPSQALRRSGSND